MNFIEQESAQKLRGGFYTDQSIARFLVKWVGDSSPRRILEPSCGDGAFLEALEACEETRSAYVFGCEIDPHEAAVADRRTRLSRKILCGDFLRWHLFEGQCTERFDAAVGNPPFIRYQYLPAAQQFLAEKIFDQHGLRFTKHTNAWVSFTLAAFASLRPGGRLAMVVPAEILHIPHAQSLRKHLAEHCSRILLLAPTEIWFGDTLQGVVLLLAERKRHESEKSRGVSIVPLRDRATLLEEPRAYFEDARYTNGAAIEGKWMQVLLSERERTLLERAATLPAIRVFKDIASADVGIVTGANDFFLVAESTISRYGMERFAHPMFGRADHVKGLVFRQSDHETNRREGKPTYFLHFPRTNTRFNKGTQKYLAEGVAQGLPKRYKCRIREPWFAVPSVYPTPIGMLKRAHHFPRLILNAAGALTTDTAYRIRPLGVSAEALVLGFVNSLTILLAELEGRHYGGGVLELVPSEIERLLVPIVPADRRALQQADSRFRRAPQPEDFVRDQDARILAVAGLSVRECDELHEAWLRLRARRHREPRENVALEPEAVA